MISAVVLTKDEEKNIERCLSSLSWCDEIVIVDDYSEDHIMERIKKQELGIKDKKPEIKIFKRHLNGDFAGQRNFGLKKAKGDWVLFVDADEIISEVLASEIKAQISNLKNQNYNSKLKTDQTVGFYMRRKDYFLGKWLRHGETANVKLLRLAKKNIGCWQGRIHETWEIEGEVADLENPLLHYPHKKISQFLKEINWYTDLVAQCWKEEGRKVAFWEIIVYPLGKFVQNYILRAGFLDGIPGLILAIFMSFHSFLARGKLLSLRSRV